jgi:hypothetical protein
LEWLAGLAAGGLEVVLVHPEGTLPELPPGVQPHALARRRGGWRELSYEQRHLGRAAAEVGADLLLILGDAVPLRAGLPVVAVPTIGPPPTPGRGLEGLRRAAGLAGLRGASAWLAAADLPTSGRATHVYPPFVSPRFLPSGSDEPGPDRRWVLCYDTDPADLQRALAAWTWVDGSLGDSFPLVFVSDQAAAQDRVSEATAAFDVADSVSVRSPGGNHPALFCEAAALLSVRPSAWGQPYRWALANGVPVAAFDTGAAGSIVGEAGYLISDGSTRTLGAACLSVLVQDDLADSLRSRGLRRAESYLDTPPVEWIGGLIESFRTRELA